jgi:2-methylcitrate dehydratase PrpD
MKKLLLLLTLATNIQAQDGSFSGTVFDLDSGRIQVINGSVDSPQPKDTLLQTMRRINAELKESNARLSAEIAASHQLEELRRQTRLLQEIADK